MPPQVVPVEVPHPITGRIRTRYANNTREHGLAPHIIQHDHTLGDVPREPNVIVQGKMSKLNQNLLHKLRLVSRGYLGYFQKNLTRGSGFREETSLGQTIITNSVLRRGAG